ncbi:hypothetical protein PsorP6_011558 [Peronosclerospora sorghi]|uniref:Uncharacterized protein n=1 Tax=Peronosclerospora sorghi TaxID=230839 RepID=A0ACC0WMB1_9STRA|nr:hypothetical protein PsorP6_011558 [Peronosclerospora sorghi]
MKQSLCLEHVSNTSPSVLKRKFSCRTIESSASSNGGMELSATSQVTLQYVWSGTDVGLVEPRGNLKHWLAREVFDDIYRVEPHRMEGIDVYSTPLWHLKRAGELSYVRINLPLDSQHEASRRQTRVKGGCLLEMKQSLCLEHVSNTSLSVLKQKFSCRTIESSASSSGWMELGATSQVTLQYLWRVTDVGLLEQRGNLKEWLGWVHEVDSNCHLVALTMSCEALADNFLARCCCCCREMSPRLLLLKGTGELHLLYARLSFSAAGGEPISSSLTTCKHEKFSTIYIEWSHIEWKVSTSIRRRCDILRKTWNSRTSASTCR